MPRLEDDNRIGDSTFRLARYFSKVGTVVWSDETACFWLAIPLSVTSESGDIVPAPQDQVEPIRWRRLPTELNALLARVQPGQWDDLQGDIEQAAAVGALTMQTYRNTSYMRPFFRHDQDDTISLCYQQRHGWNLGEVRNHLHFTPVAAADGVAVFAGVFAWDAVGVELPALAGWTPFRVEHPITAAMQYREQVVPLFSSTPPVNCRVPSALLNVRLSRLGTDPNDTYTGNNPDGPTAQANICLRAHDTHFQYSTIGTITEYGS